MDGLSVAGVSRLVLLGGWACLLILFARYVPWSDGLRATAAGVREEIPGLLLQGASFVIEAVARRPGRGTVLGHASPVDAVLLVVVAALVALGIWFIVGGARALGPHWTMGPRVQRGRGLVTTGPFAWVRHPIYTGLAAMLLASGLVYSFWWAVVLALGVYAAGTAQRIRAEEPVLSRAFGADYERYRRRVQAVVPWRRRS